MLHAGVGGIFTIKKEVGDANGNPIPGTAEVWQPHNMVLNNGLEMMKCGATGKVSHYGYLQLGVGNTAPVATDLALSSFLVSAQITSVPAIGPSDLIATVPWVSVTVTKTFAQGAVIGNLSETGFGPDAQGNLFSKALILDSSDNPTVIPCTDIDIVTVSYQLRIYIDLTPVAKTFVVDSVTYTVTQMWGPIDTELARQWITGATYGNQGGRFQNNNAGGAGYQAYTTDVGVAGEQTSNPGGDMTGSAYTVTDAPTVGEYWTDVAGTFSATAGALTGIVGACVGTNSAGIVPAVTIKNSISPAIDKSNLEALSITSRISWGRYTG